MTIELFMQYVLPVLTGAVSWIAAQYVSKTNVEADIIKDLNTALDNLVDKYIQTLKTLTEVQKKMWN